MQEETACNHCKVTFKYTKGTRKGQYCSRPCASRGNLIIAKKHIDYTNRAGMSNPNYKGGGTEFTCKECEEKFKVPNHALRSKKHGGHFCSIVCKNKFKAKVRMTDEQVKLTKNTRIRVVSHLKRPRLEDKFLKEVGTTVFTLKAHIKSTFKEGMTWENHGKWHIDHIKPVSSFTYTSKEDEHFSLCWHYTNLQALWEHENAAKKGENRRILFEKELLILPNK